MKNLTSSVYTFEKLIEGNYLYVDKTEHIWRLIEDPYGIYFLSRPRRFGKSLTLSTLKAVFQNKRELFNGLALDSKPFAWKKYPVIHLDLADRPSGTAERLNAGLVTALNESATTLGIALTAELAPERFRELILKAAAGPDKVVILIDEYDKPILDNIVNPEIEGIRSVLENFYSVIKGTEPYQRFVLMTGVSKFSKVSVFSKLNNLSDIGMSAKFATMLGYTQEELETYFAEHIDNAAKTLKISTSELLAQLRHWYNGYRFEERSQTVYNPVSIAKFFESGNKFKNYWFETGTPSFLLKLAKEQKFDFERNLKEPVSELAFASYEIGKLKTLPMLFQTGYLTIKDSVREGEDTFYHLDFPNREVESAFEAYFLEEFAGVDKESVEVYAAEMAKALRAGDIDSFMTKAQRFFAGVPYDIQLKAEKYYQTIFFIVFRLLGLRVEAEARTSRGRVDATARTDKFVYLFEFKLDGTADAAMAQIRDREYFQNYLTPGKQTILVGANFDYAARNIGEWKVETIDATA